MGGTKNALSFLPNFTPRINKTYTSVTENCQALKIQIKHLFRNQLTPYD